MTLRKRLRVWQRGQLAKRASMISLAEQPERAEDFHAAMKLFATDPGLSMRHVLDAFDWAGLPKGSMCVDLGGGEGEAAITVARENSHLRWEVQDLPNAFANLPPLPKEVEDRVTFREHDFFTPQASGIAPSVFFLRWILHNHSDSQCLKILRALSSAFEHNTEAKSGRHGAHPPCDERLAQHGRARNQSHGRHNAGTWQRTGARG